MWSCYKPDAVACKQYTGMVGVEANEGKKLVDSLMGEISAFEEKARWQDIGGLGTGLLIVTILLCWRFEKFALSYYSIFRLWGVIDVGIERN